MGTRYARSRVFLVILFTVASVVVPAVARGQLAPPPEVPRLSVGAGAGIVDPFHSDLAFTAPAWEASVRVRMGNVVALEVGGSQWWHSEESVRLNQPVQGQSGPIGTIDRIDQRTSRSQMAFEVNLLATGRLGRVTIWGGGGAGVLFHQRTFSQAFTGCHVTVPIPCQGTENTYWNGDATFQGVGGADVRIAGRLAAYGSVRMAIPTRDAGSGELRLIVGARFGLR